MKDRIIPWIVVAAVVALTALSVRSVDLTWDPPPASDQVQRTVVQVMELPSSNIATFSTTGPVISLPGGASARRFRAAHSNSFGLSDWTPWVSVPGTAQGIKVTVPLAP